MRALGRLGFFLITMASGACSRDPDVLAIISAHNGGTRVSPVIGMAHTFAVTLPSVNDKPLFKALTVEAALLEPVGRIKWTSLVLRSECPQGIEILREEVVTLPTPFDHETRQYTMVAQCAGLSDGTE